MLEGGKIGPFEIDRELGSGAMGTVYLARFRHNDGTEMPVALKIVALGLLGNEGAMARFEREASILKQLKHPHIVRLIATGKYKKTPFIAMEYIDGEALDATLTRRGRLPWELVAEYAKQLCDALQYAHEKGIIHRDLKPSNLMVTTEGVMKLTDFGIAKDTDVTALTGANSTIGTAAYMSPEQCKGEKFLTNKSDLYSLGVVLYELVTGKKPYVAETTIEMFQKHVFPEHTPVRPARLVPDLPVWMDNLIMFLLEKDKDRRPLDAATVSKMISDIELKVQAQQSAGADRAKARKIDRTADTGEMTDEDKEAARALRGKKKKKKKSDAAPWYTKTWVKAVPLVLAIGLLGTGILFAVKSAGGRGSPPAGVSADEAAGKDWEKALHKRISSGMFKKGEGWEDKETYEVTWKAMERERDGNLKQAADLWADARRRLEDLSGEKIPAWRWVAEKRLKDIEAVDRKYAELQAKWKQQQIDELPWKFNAADPMSLATLALRYEQFGDKGKALATWETLSKDLDGKMDDWSWYLLARRQMGSKFDMKASEIATATVRVLDQKIDELARNCRNKDELEANGAFRRKCRNDCRDIIELYGDESSSLIKEHVGKARKWLDELLKSM